MRSGEESVPALRLKDVVEQASEANTRLGQPAFRNRSVRLLILESKAFSGSNPRTVSRKPVGGTSSLKAFAGPVFNVAGVPFFGFRSLGQCDQSSGELILVPIKAPKKSRIPDLMQIGTIVPIKLDLKPVPSSVVVVPNVERLVKVLNQVDQVPEGHPATRSGGIWVKKNLAELLDLGNNAVSAATVS
jgi:hypothetical protein